jgi:Glycosyltransferase family 87
MSGGRAFWAWTAVGTVAAAAVALASPQLVDGGVITWWFKPHFASARPIFYAGIAGMCVAWLALGRTLAGVPCRRLWVVGILWCMPLALGPALFSRDVYSYLAQGEILHLGLNPYHAAPVVLAHHGQGHLLAAVSPFWRQTTAPYGPLFLALVSLIGGVAGPHLIVDVLLVRVLDLIGLALLAVYVPRLARRLGADPARAAWLAALSPLVLLQLIAAGHNDVLMAGLMVAGVALAVEHRPLAAVAVCAVAATIKLPAAAAIVFIVVAAARAAPERAERLRLVARALAITVLVLAAVSLATGVGLDWITTGVFSTPQKVRLAITPATGVGYTLASLAHDLGIAANSRSVEHVFAGIAAVLTVALAVLLLWRVRPESLVRDLGVFLVAVVLGGPAAWPWYLIWGLALLAAWPRWQRSIAFALAVTVPVFLVKPDGILLLSRSAAPAVVVIYAALVAVAWFSWRRRQRAAPAMALT